MGCWTLYINSHKPVFNHLVTEALAQYNTYYIMVRDRWLEVEQQVHENEIKEAFSDEYIGLCTSQKTIISASLLSYGTI